MRYSVSSTAEFGDYYAGPQVHRRSRQGNDARVAGANPGWIVAEEWIAENEAGRERFLSMREKAQGSETNRSARSCER